MPGLRDKFGVACNDGFMQLPPPLAERLLRANHGPYVWVGTR